MGTEVLALDADTASAADSPGLAVYVHRTPGGDGQAVTYAVVNSSASESHTVAPANGDATVYLLTSNDFDAPTAALNGTELRLGDDAALPTFDGAPADGPITVAPASVTFVVCR